MSYKKSTKKAFHSPILKEKKANNTFGQPAQELSDTSLQLSIDKSFRKSESLNPKEKRMRRTIEKNIQDYKKLLEETHLPEIFRIICNEIVSKEIKENEVYSYTANRFKEIGKLLENEIQEEQMKNN